MGVIDVHLKCTFREVPILEVTVTTFRKHIPDYLGKVRKGEDISLHRKIVRLHT